MLLGQKSFQISVKSLLVFLEEHNNYLRLAIWIDIFLYFLLPILNISARNYDKARIFDIDTKGFGAAFQKLDSPISLTVIILRSVRRWVNKNPILEISRVFYPVFEHKSSIFWMYNWVKQEFDIIKNESFGIFLTFYLYNLVVLVQVKLLN